MENMYGIGVANRYALFLDDDADPLEVLKVQEQEKELKKKTKVAEKENKIKTEPPVKTKTNPAQRKGIKETQNVKPEKREESKPKSSGPQNNSEPRNERNVKFSNDNREERNNRRNRDDKPYNGPADGNKFNNRERGDRAGGDRNEKEDRPPRREFSRGDGDAGGDNGPRGGRGGVQGARSRQPRGDGPRRNFDQRGKREFDRQSGSDKTGIKPVDKRDGAGAHNWGSHKDDIETELNKPVDDSGWDTEKPDPAITETKETTTTEGVIPSESSEATTAVAPVEEEVKELTLDEWKAQRAAGRQKPQYNLRKAGEGEDLSQWKKMYALNKKKEAEEEDSDDEEYDASEYPQRVGRQKHVLDIEVRFSNSRRGGGPGGRGPRGGLRGGPRGERGPGGGANRDRPVTKSFRNPDEQAEEHAGRGEKSVPRNNRQSAPKVDDEHDFPSLG